MNVIPVNLILKRTLFLILASALILCISAPVSAILQEVTVKGALATVSPAKNTLTIEHPLQYGCTYPSTGSPVCSYIPVNTTESLTGTVPDIAAFSLFKSGDTIVATSIGGAGTTWITLAKLYGSRPNEEFVTDVIGDPSTIPTPLVGNYSLDLSTNPDCTKCSGTLCTASSSIIIVKSSGNAVMRYNLTPGQAFSYNGRNDGSNITGIFVNGQAGSQECAGQSGMAGPQPVSDYIISIVPPLSLNQNNIRTATTTRPDEALTSPETTAVAPVAATTTAKSGSLPLAVIGAVGIMVLVSGIRRR